MDNIYIYRNTAIEYLFKNKNICYSGYEEISKTSDEKDILMLYFLPYKYDEDRIISFIDDYKKRIEYIIESNSNKKIFVVSLYNYFYQNFVYNDNKVKDAIESFNKFMISKSTGGLGEYEYSSLLINTGDLAANKIRQGNMPSESIEGIETLLYGLDGPNADKYFGYPHKGIQSATKTIYESIGFAEEDLEQRKQYAQPVMDASSYDNPFKKLGL